MADLFERYGVAAQAQELQKARKPVDLFEARGITPPTYTERNKAALSSGVDLNSEAEEVQLLKQEAQSHQEQTEKLARSRVSEETIEEWKKNPITIGESFKWLEFADVLPFGGIKQGADALGIKNIADKYEEGAELTPAEKEKLNSFIDKTTEMNIRGMTFGGKVSYYGSALPAFMVEFAATAGFGKAAATVTTKAITKGVEVGVVKALAAKTTAVAANVAVRTAALPSMYVEKYGERRLNDRMSITDKGQIILEESEEAPAVSALKAYAYTSAEVASELTGAAIGKYVINPLTKAVRTPLTQGINKLPTKLKHGLYEAYKKIQPNARISKVFTAGGWNGMLAELGEERVADVLRESLNLSLIEGYTFDDVLDGITPSKEELLLEAGLISIVGGAKTSADIAVNILKTRGASHAEAASAVDNMTVTEQEALVSEAVKVESQNTPESPPLTEDPIIAAQVNAALQGERPSIDHTESSFEKAYRDWVDSLAPIEKAEKLAVERGATIPAGLSPNLLSRTYAGIIGMARQNIQSETYRINSDGNIEITGKGLRPILEDFDNAIIHVEPKREAREKDLKNYMIAKRTLLDLKQREDVEVSKETLTAQTSVIKGLTQKYGEDLQWLDTYAQEIYAFQERILLNLVDSGNMSQEQNNNILATNPHYIPFQRVLNDVTVKDAVTSKGVFTGANAKRVIKRIKGSDKEIKDPIQSIIANTVKILDIAQRNRVAQSVASLADYMPEYIQRLKPQMIKSGTAHITVSYDKQLREKLTQAIEALGHNLEYKKTLNTRGEKGLVMGSYSFHEKLVRMRLGSTDATLSHEVGHMIDYHLKLNKKLINDPAIKKELKKLAEDRLSSSIQLMEKNDIISYAEVKTQMESAEHKAYVKNDREIVANFYDAYVNSPEKLAQKAPNALKRFNEILEEDPKYAFLKDIKPSQQRGTEILSQDVWSESPYEPKGSITVFENGKKKYYAVSQPILEAMQQLQPMQLTFLVKLFSIPTAVLRAGATLVPEFWARNVLRDQTSAFIQSKVRPTPIDMIQGLCALIGKTELYNDWMKSGGSFNSYMELSDTGLEKAYNELLKPQGKIKRYLKNPLKLLENISGALEQGTRIGAFLKAKKKGMSDIEASLEARQATLDFARGGKNAKALNRFLPFFNAGVQGSDKLIRTMKENPKATAMWGAATITLPSILLTGYYLYGASDDERKEYLEIPQWQRDMFWVYKSGDTWLRYPKPFTLGYVFGSVPERFMMWMYQGDKPEGKQLWQELIVGIAGAFSPVYDPSALIPPLPKVIIESVTNYNFFLGRDIYSEWLGNLDPEMRTTTHTSETAKAVGEAFNISPALIDNALRGTIAGSAQYVTGAGDKILEQVKRWNEEEISEKPSSLSDVPLIRAFVVRDPTGSSAQSVQDFYNIQKEVMQKDATLKKLEGDKKQEYHEKNATMLGSVAMIEAASKQIRALNSEKKRVYDEVSIDADTKANMIKELDDQVLMRAMEANESFAEMVLNIE